MLRKASARIAQKQLGKSYFVSEKRKEEQEYEIDKQCAKLTKKTDRLTPNGSSIAVFRNSLTIARMTYIRMLQYRVHDIYFSFFNFQFSIIMRLIFSVILQTFVYYLIMSSLATLIIRNVSWIFRDFIRKIIADQLSLMFCWNLSDRNLLTRVFFVPLVSYLLLFTPVQCLFCLLERLNKTVLSRNKYSTNRYTMCVYTLPLNLLV